MITLEVLYGALLFFFLLKPQFIKKPSWFKFAVILFAGRMVLALLWLWFLVWGNFDLSRVIGVISGAVNGGLWGLSIICLLMGQVGSIAHLKEEAHSDAKKPADKK